MITAAAPAAGANGARLGGGTGDVEQGRPGLARGSDGVIVQDVLPPHQQVGGEVRGWAWLQWTILRCVGLHKRPAGEGQRACVRGWWTGVAEGRACRQ